MALLESSICWSCSYSTPELISGPGAVAEWELRRCKRCCAIRSVLIAKMDCETGLWHPTSGRARCHNRVHDEPCGSQAFERLPADFDLAAEGCPNCDHELTHLPIGIAD